MTWLILLSHAFNPFLIPIILTQQDQEKTVDDSGSFIRLYSAVLTSLLAYLFWLGTHFLIMKIMGSNFDFDEFIGVGKGIAYFLPFVLGGVILIIDTLARHRLRRENTQVLVSSLSSIIVFFGTYFMLVNYLAWIAN
jgi:hypothetical protein